MDLIDENIKINLFKEDVLILIEQYLDKQGNIGLVEDMFNETNVLYKNRCDNAIFLYKLLIEGQYHDFWSFCDILTNKCSISSKELYWLLCQHKYAEDVSFKYNKKLKDAYLNLNVQMDYEKCQEIDSNSSKYLYINSIISSLKSYTNEELVSWAQDFNIVNHRKKCFTSIYDIISPFLLRTDKTPVKQTSRLEILILRGLIFEYCVALICNKKLEMNENQNNRASSYGEDSISYDSPRKTNNHYSIDNISLLKNSSGSYDIETQFNIITDSQNTTEQQMIKSKKNDLKSYIIPEFKKIDNTNEIVNKKLANENKTINKKMVLKKPLRQQIMDDAANINLRYDQKTQIPESIKYDNSNMEISIIKESTSSPFEIIGEVTVDHVIRCAEFNPAFDLFAVGTNSSKIFLCEIDSESIVAKQLDVLENVHNGSVYCLSWNRHGNLIATGSNDKIINLIPFHTDLKKYNDNFSFINCHTGIVRDLFFLNDNLNSEGILVSAGSGDNKIHVTDCSCCKSLISFKGHTDTIFSIESNKSCTIVSASQDKTIKFWDIRSCNCFNAISSNLTGGPVISVSMDNQDRFCVSGYSNGTILIWDLRMNKEMYKIKLHQDSIRSIKYAYHDDYILTASYDGTATALDMKDVTSESPPLDLVVAKLNSKMISSRWNPRNDNQFLTTTTSATCSVWELGE
ncbi:hypothetical protein A3Q56_06489 [Intoshia linei]|uniref:Anaphase-promoting complex subunit 4-like WD40 domain-containing protein n=1 Tax=Intoshia linei TaxID=1819745 RepID=A0A177AWA4_9BILA|nr:hypothetical protein A3Q56_06489 [Intoshia linei]